MKYEVLESFMLFLLTFVLVFIVYQVLFLKEYGRNIKNRKNKSNILNKKKPVEVRLLEMYYKVDVSKLKYGRLLNLMAFVSSFDIALIVTIACVFDRGFIQIIVAFLIIAPIIYLSYLLLSIYLKHKIKKYEQKGMK